MVGESHGIQILDTLVISSFDRNEPDENSWTVALLPCIVSNSPHSLVSIRLERWDRGHVRSLRYAFNNNGVYSCLTPSSHVRDAVHQRLGVVTAITPSLLSSLQERSAPVPTILVQFDNLKECPFELLGPSSLVRDKQQPPRFTASHLPERACPIFRFHGKGSPLAMYVGFVVGSTTGTNSSMPEPNVVHSVITAIAASTPNSQMVSNMLSAIQISQSTRTSTAGGPRSGCGDTCEHDRVYATVTAISISNQRVITVTLGKRDGAAWVESKAKLCLLGREVWFAEEALTQPDKPRKKGLLDWVK